MKKESLLNNEILRTALRVSSFLLGIYLIFQCLNGIELTTGLGGNLLGPNSLVRGLFGFALVVAGIVPEKLVKNDTGKVSDELKDSLLSNDGGTPRQSRHKEGVSWSVNYPGRVPNPVDVDIDRAFDFLVEFEVENNTDSSLELEAKIESTNQGIVFVASEVVEELKWFPIPHKEAKVLWLDDEIDTIALGEGQTTKFRFHAVYRPKFAVPFYPGYLFLNYGLKGKFSKGEEFSSGLQRIEIPFDN